MSKAVHPPWKGSFVRNLATRPQLLALPYCNGMTDRTEDVASLNPPSDTSTPTTLPSTMCYFDQTRWTCGYWKWGNFRQQCNKEYRTGETCGLKLVYHTTYKSEICKLCDQRTKKERRVDKMTQDIRRWRREGNRRATIEKTERDIREVNGQILELVRQHADRQRNIN